MNLELLELQNEVKQFYKKLEKELEIKVYYDIFYSKFSANADILFIGINPGELEVYMTGELQKFEYLDYDYSLARETKEFFELAGYPSLLEDFDRENKVVKTNLYYVSTKGLSELNDFFKKLKSNDLEDEFVTLSRKWTNKIIELTNPKIIIYEGKTAFDESPPFIDNEKLIENLNEEFVSLYRYEELSFSMISYDRFRSNIRNKNGLSKILKIELDRIYNLKT